MARRKRQKETIPEENYTRRKLYQKETIPKGNAGRKLLTPFANCDKLLRVTDKSGPLSISSSSWGGGTMRVGITMACTDCKRRNYTTNKNKKNNPDRIEMKKYCKFCQTHTVHKETR